MVWNVTVISQRLLKRREFVQIGLGGLAASALLGRFSWRLSKGDDRKLADSRAFSRPTGEPSIAPSLCRECPASCGVLLKIVDGRAVGLRGNPRFPTNAGTLCPKGMASLQRLYHPDRVKRAGVAEGLLGGPRRPLGKEEGLRLLVNRLSEADRAPGAVAVLCGTERGLVRRLWKSAGKSFGADLVQFRQEGLDSVHALSLLGGGAATVGLDLDRCAYVLSFGVPLLEASQAPAPVMWDYGNFRQGGEVRGRLVQLEPRFSITAMKSDEWVPCAPGSYGRLALAIACVLIEKGFVSSGAAKGLEGYDAFSSMVRAEFTPEKVAVACGVSAAKIRALAVELATHSPAVALGGGCLSLPWSSPEETAAVLALNLLIGSFGGPAGVLFAENLPHPASLVSDDSMLDALVQRGNGLKCLLVVNDDPVGRSTRKETWRALFASVPFSACLTLEETPTSRLARLVLPAAHPFESRQDDLVAHPSAWPLWGFAEPALKPPEEAFSAVDLAFALTQGSPLPLGDATVKTSDEALEAWVASLVAHGFTSLPEALAVPPATIQALSPEAALRSARNDGGLWAPGRPAGAENRKWTLSGLQALRSAPSERTSDDYPLSLHLYEPLVFAGASGASLPFLLEVSDPLGREIWETFLELSPADAGRLALADGDYAMIESRRGQARARIWVFQGLTPGVAAMSITGPADGRFVQGLADPLSLAENTLDARSRLPKIERTRIRVRKT